MKKNFSDYLVAIIVIVCSVLLLGALTFALSGRTVGAADRVLQVDFRDVTGIKVHSEVRYAGAPAGTVAMIRHLTPEERSKFEGQTKDNAVRVTLHLSKEIPPLPQDIQASLGSDTLLSEKFVALSAGSPGIPKLANNALIQGQPAFSIDEALREAGPLLKDTSETIATLKEGVKNVMPKLEEVLVSTKSTANTAEKLLNNADSLIDENEDEIHASLEKLQETLTTTNDLLKRTRSFVTTTEKEFSERMEELSVIFQNLKVTATYSKSLTKSLAEKPSRLIWGMGKKKLTSEEEILKNEKPVPANRR